VVSGTDRNEVRDYRAGDEEKGIKGKGRETTQRQAE